VGKLMEWTTQKWTFKIGECFLPFIAGAVGIQSDENNVWTEDGGNGRKGCTMWIFIIYASREIMGYQWTVVKSVGNVSWMGVLLSWRDFWLENGEGESPFRSTVFI